MASHGDDAAPESLPPAALEGVEPGGRLADLDAFAAEVVAALEARPLQTTPLQHALAEIVSEVRYDTGTHKTEPCPSSPLIVSLRVVKMHGEHHTKYRETTSSPSSAPLNQFSRGGTLYKHGIR